jgi:hypothetical protein
MVVMALTGLPGPMAQMDCPVRMEQTMIQTIPVLVVMVEQEAAQAVVPEVHQEMPEHKGQTSALVVALVAVVMAVLVVMETMEVMGEAFREVPDQTTRAVVEAK